MFPALFRRLVVAVAFVCAATLNAHASSSIFIAVEGANVSDEEIADAMSPFGPVAGVEVLATPDDGRAITAAIVTFEDADSAQYAGCNLPLVDLVGFPVIEFPDETFDVDCRNDAFAEALRAREALLPAAKSAEDDLEAALEDLAEAEAAAAPVRESAAKAEESNNLKQLALDDAKETAREAAHAAAAAIREARFSFSRELWTAAREALREAFRAAAAIFPAEVEAQEAEAALEAALEALAEAEAVVAEANHVVSAAEESAGNVQKAVDDATQAIEDAVSADINNLAWNVLFVADKQAEAVRAALVAGQAIIDASACPDDVLTAARDTLVLLSQRADAEAAAAEAMERKSKNLLADAAASGEDVDSAWETALGDINGVVGQLLLTKVEFAMGGPRLGTENSAAEDLARYRDVCGVVCGDGGRSPACDAADDLRRLVLQNSLALSQQAVEFRAGLQRARHDALLATIQNQR